LSAKWGEYDVSGLQGSITDGGGYAFLMNSMKMAWPLVPMVKYEPRFARAIGKMDAEQCKMLPDCFSERKLPTRISGCPK